MYGVTTGVLGAEVGLLKYAYQTARAYHYTFGMNGGYENMLFEGAVQSAGNSDLNYYSLIGSGFIPGNSLKTILEFEISTMFINMDGKSLVLSVPSSGTIFDKTSTIFWMNGYAKSKFGTKFLGLYFDYTVQKIKTQK